MLISQRLPFVLLARQVSGFSLPSFGTGPWRSRVSVTVTIRLVMATAGRFGVPTVLRGERRLQKYFISIIVCGLFEFTVL